MPMESNRATRQPWIQFLTDEPNPVKRCQEVMATANVKYDLWDFPGPFKDTLGERLLNAWEHGIQVSATYSTIPKVTVRSGLDLLMRWGPSAGWSDGTHGAIIGLPIPDIVFVDEGRDGAKVDGAGRILNLAKQNPGAFRLVGSTDQLIEELQVIQSGNTWPITAYLAKIFKNLQSFGDDPMRPPITVIEVPLLHNPSSATSRQLHRLKDHLGDLTTHLIIDMVELGLKGDNVIRIRPGDIPEYYSLNKTWEGHNDTAKWAIASLLRHRILSFGTSEVLGYLPGGVPDNMPAVAVVPHGMVGAMNAIEKLGIQKTLGFSMLRGTFAPDLTICMGDLHHITHSSHNIAMVGRELKKSVWVSLVDASTDGESLDVILKTAMNSIKDLPEQHSHAQIL